MHDQIFPKNRGQPGGGLLADRRVDRGGAFIAGTVVTLLGIITLAGWVFQNAALKNILPKTGGPIPPNHALAMVLCGGALSLLSWKKLTAPLRFLAAGMAATVIALCLLSLAENFLHLDFGIDHWFIGPAAAGPNPGRILPITAVCLALAAAALFSASRRLQNGSRVTLIGGVSGIVLGAGVVPLIAFYLELLFGPSWNFMGMNAASVPLAFVFVFLGGGLVALLRGHAHLTWALNPYTTAGFTIGFVVILVAAGLTYNFHSRAHETAGQLGHAQQILTEAEEVRSTVLVLENQQRGYTITGDVGMLQDWEAHELEVGEHLGKLRRLIDGDSNQEPRLVQLEDLVSQRISRAKQAIAARRDFGFAAAQELAADGTDTRLREQNRAARGELEKEEYLRRDQRQKDSDISSQRAFLILPLGIFLCLAVLSLGLFFLNAGMSERLHAERSLSKSEEGMRAILDSALDCIITMNHHGNVVEFNPAAEKTFGYRREEAIGQPLSDLIIPPALREQHRAGLTRFLATGKTQALGRRLELSAVGRDGREFPIELAIIRIGNQEPPMFTGFIRNITERKRAEEALRQAEGKYRSIFDHASEGIFQNTPEGMPISANPALARMLGFASPEELIRERNDIANQTFVDPTLRPELQRMLEEKGSVDNFEYEVKRKDGSVIFISENIRLVRDAAGNPLYYEGTMQDITERKQAEEALVQAEEKYRSIFDNASQGIFQITPEGILLSANPALARMLRFASPEELIRERNIPGQTYVDPSLRPVLQRRLEEEGYVDNFEYEIKRKDGSTIFISENIRLVRDAAGNPLYYEGTMHEITERKRAEQVLAESERRLGFLNDLSEATHGLSQPKEIMSVVAQRLGKYLGVSRCAYADVGKDGNEFIIPDDYTDNCASIVGQYHLSDFGDRTHSNLAAGRTVILRDIDTEVAWSEGGSAYDAIQIKAMIACPLVKGNVLVAAMAVHHSAAREWTEGEIGLVEEVVERCWSIIERARAELVVHESEKRLSLIIAASNDGIFEHDFLSGVIVWSDRMYEMFGLERSSFLPTIEGFTALLHPDDRAQFQEAVAGQMAHGGRYDAHTRIRRGDGSYGNFLGRGEVGLDATGKPIGIVGSLSDVTTLLEAEQKLIEQGNLLNLAQDAIMVRDMDDRIEFWNHGAETLYGWSADEVCGHRNDDFLGYEEQVKILAERTLLETGIWSGECRHRTKHGKTVIVRSRWTLVRDEHGQPKSKLIIATDMTEQKRIEEHFLRAQRLESIGTLASGVAHDLNNILGPIMMAAPLIRDTKDEADREKFIDIIETSVQRGADIIKQVLTFARGADGDRSLLQPIQVLEEVAKIASQTFPKSIALRSRHEENIRLLEADPTQLHQVMLNLCINARDAMPNGGELGLSVENFDVDEHYASMTPGATAGPHVMLQVTDSGTGIPKQVLDKIFEPFFTTKGVGQGTGLGLSTVAGIIRGHGGFIHVYSEPGHTSFKIFLPAKETVGIGGAMAVETMVPRARGETILLVDDEPNIRQTAEVILTNHGYKVITAEDAPTALALFARQVGQISAVVTDLAMPGMGGLMLVRTLRRMEPGIKVIVSTGRADNSQATEIASLNIDGFLTKPYNRRNLLLKLNEVLNRKLLDAA